MTKQKSILTITLNPAVDISTTVAQVVPGQKLYCAPPKIDPGGGGVNVARAIKRLGGEANALVVVGGVSGARLCEMLADEGVTFDPIHVDSETRESFAVIDDSTGDQFRFGLPGRALTRDAADLVLAAITEKSKSYDYVVLSGSVAAGLGDDFPLLVQSVVSSQSKKLIVDTSQDALRHLTSAAASPVFFLRLDQKESELVAGFDLKQLDKHVDFAQSLIANGVAKHIISGRGAEGSLLVTTDKILLCRPPKLNVVSKIGAGDAFVGAFSLSLAQDFGLERALQSGVAAAGATMASDGTGLFSSANFDRLLPQCTLETL